MDVEKIAKIIIDEMLSRAEGTYHLDISIDDLETSAQEAALRIKYNKGNN
jgi:hypothetical protein